HPRPLLLALLSSLCFLMSRPPPGSPLFPYTTLFRSDAAPGAGGRPRRARARPHRPHPAGPGRQPVGGRPLRRLPALRRGVLRDRDRKSTRLNSSHVKISYAVFCLKKKNSTNGIYVII